MEFKRFDPLFCVEEKMLDPSKSKHFEGLFTQGSGYVSIRGSYEEGLVAAVQDEEYMRMPANVTLEKPRHSRSKWGVYLPGVTGRHPLLKEEMVNLPYLLEFVVYAEGEKLDMDFCNILDYRRWLDLRDGVLYRDFIWKTASGCIFKASYRRYISADKRKLVVQEMEFEAVEGSACLKLEGGINTNVRTNGYQHFQQIDMGFDGEAYAEVTTDTGTSVYMRSSTFINGNKVCNGQARDGRTFAQAEWDIRTEKKVKISKISVIASDRDAEGDLFRQAARDMLDTSDPRVMNLYERHEHIWGSRWKTADIEIEGNDFVQLAVRVSIYHLLRACNDQDDRIAICAKGFAGEAYYGHFFWDTEVYLLPFFIYTHPEAAKKLLGFRVNTLEGAIRNARSYGYKGARFPWESTITGEEQCSNWQYADNEVHVTADVVYGIWHYYIATGDFSFLKKCTRLLIETSRFWADRVEIKMDGSVNLNGVMGPDEYVAFCNNNSYTNYMVTFALKSTVDLINEIKQKDAGYLDAMMDSLGLEDKELIHFMYIAQSLKIPEGNGRLIRQCDDFEKLEDIDFNQVWKDQSKPFGSCISQEKNYRSKALKQADVLMLFHLFPRFFEKKRCEANFDYYFPMTTHDSSLSYCIHSILAARLERMELSSTLFEKTLGIDLDAAKGGAAEGIHIANCGGIWQSIVMGFAGASWAYESNEPHFEPRLPADWKRIQFNYRFKGERYRVTVTHEGAMVKQEESVYDVKSSNI